MNDSQKWLLLALSIFGGVLIYLLGPVLTPFLIAALLAYLGDPVVDWMETRGLPRTAAVGGVFVLLMLVLVSLPLLLIPALEGQLSALIKGLPGYLQWLQKHFSPWLHQTLGIDPAVLDWARLKTAVQEHWMKFGSFAGGLVDWVSASGLALAGLLANVVLVPVVAFYLLRDWDSLLTQIRDMLPRRLEPGTVRLATECDEVLGAFLRGQLLVMLALSMIYTLGLWMVGLELALLIGLLAGLVSFVPYLGFIVGILAASIAAIMQFHDLTYLLPVFAVFAVGQALEGMVLTPKLVGDRIGLHPVAVIFAVMAGAQLFGFVGVLIALPVAAVVMVWLRYLHHRYTQSALYSDS